MIEHEGEWFREQIEKKGLSSAELASRIGYDPTTLYRWLVRTKISAKRKKLMGDALGIDLREHFEDMELLYLPDDNDDYKKKYAKLDREHESLKQQFEDYREKYPAT